MSSVYRGFLWIATVTLFIGVFLFSTAAVLWTAGDKAISKSTRYAALSERQEVVMAHRDALRIQSANLDKAYLAAASAAQAEAGLREELSHILREAGGEVSSIKTQPRERQDSDTRLRLQVVLNAPQSALEPVLKALAENDPMIVVDRSDIRIASGIRRPGVAPSAERSLTITLNVSALWKEVRNG